MPRESRWDKKRIVKATLIVDKADREFIEATGNSLQSFFTALLGQYKHLNMNKWRNGSFIHHGRRITMFDTEGLNYLISQSKDPYQAGKDVARKIKETSRALNMFASDQDAIKDWLEDHSKLYGWGTVEYSQRRLVIEYPAVANQDFVRGYFEEMLAKPLSCKLANKDIQIYQVD
ncbi:MAG: hypothetical protein HY619_06140 [Thaumarchaeota archaeon]|nr:hypothetical protein [Nitrososphaerota archaeon]